MRRINRNTWKNVDWLMVGLILALMLMGWVNIYAAIFNVEHASILDMSQSYGKQLIWIVTSLFLGWIIMMIDAKAIEAASLPVYIFTMLLLAGVLVFGSEIKGAQSWYQFGGFSLQPSEFAKIGTALIVAKVLSSIVGRTNELGNTLKVLVFVAIPAGLILLQPDTGSTLVFAAFIFVLYREGFSGNFLLLGLLAIVLFVLALLFDADDLILAVTVMMLLSYAAFFEGWKFFILSTLTMFGLFFAYYYWFDNVQILVGSIAALCLGLVGYNFRQREMKNKMGRAILIAGYVGSILFMFTVGYIFNNVLQEHQRTRITVLLGEEDKLQDQINNLVALYEVAPEDSQEKAELREDIRDKRKSLDKLRKGAGWNVNQSKIAIGSGGLMGKGFLNGTQTKLDYVPEQSTDFIFCTVGEEWGFFGSSIVLLTFLALMLRIVFVAERQRSKFARLYGYAVASILFIHFAINIAMTIGLAPVIGIPLPFFSYGGSSLWGFSILFFIFVKLDSERMYVLR